MKQQRSGFVRMFRPQFAGLVLSGEKCQTVRPVPKRMPKPGDRLSLRMWTGKPYRSKQRILREAEISRVEFVEIGTTDRIVVAGRKLTPDGERAFARADGFNTPQDMLEWFNVTHGLPFIGVVICWQNSTLTRWDALGILKNIAKEYSKFCDVMVTMPERKAELKAGGRFMDALEHLRDELVKRTQPHEQIN